MYNVPMNNWQVIFYPTEEGCEPVKEYLLQLDYDTRHEIIHVMELLHINGVNLGMPYVKKINKSGLRELRIKHGSDIYRILFFAFTGRKFILLLIIKKKSDKLPITVINLAITRMNDYIARMTTLRGS